MLLSVSKGRSCIVYDVFIQILELKSIFEVPYLLYLGPLLELGPMTPNAKATAHQRKPVGRCGVALPVFPKKLKKLIRARALNTTNTVS